MTVLVVGVAEFDAAVARMVARVNAAAGPAAAAAAHVVEAETKTTLTTYTHPKGQRTNSPPGEPPALVTGTLRRSVEVSAPTVIGFGMYEARVGPTVVYARVQELGGGKSRLPARPYLSPALQRALDDGRIYEAFRATWAAAITT